MKAYIAFMKKEWIENVRTYRLFIILTVFFLLGIMNPITARYTNELIKALSPELSSISFPTPTALDSWIQFYKNVPQMGLIVFVIFFGGSLSKECTKGTLINMITKGLKRRTIILSKFTMIAIIWSISLLLCFAVTAYYTAYFWNLDGFGDILLSLLCFWLFGILLISIILLGGAFAKSSYVCLLLTGALVVFLFLINVVPSIQSYNPIRLMSSNMALIDGTMAFEDFVKAIMVSILIIVVNLMGSIHIFNKRRL